MHNTDVDWPIWVDSTPGLRESLDRVVESYPGRMTGHATTPRPKETVEKCDEIAAMARNLAKAVRELKSRHGHTYILDNHRREAVKFLCTQFESDADVGLARLGADSLAVNRVLYGLITHMAAIANHEERNRQPGKPPKPLKLLLFAEIIDRLWAYTHRKKGKDPRIRELIESAVTALFPADEPVDQSMIRDAIRKVEEWDRRDRPQILVDDGRWSIQSLREEIAKGDKP